MTRRRRPRGAPRHLFGQTPASAYDPFERSYTGKAYLLDARRYGDERTVFESVAANGDLSANELGYLASQLRRLRVRREANGYWVGEGPNRHRVYWPGFRLTDHEKDRLGRALIAEGAREKKISTSLGCSVRWVRELASDVEAESHCRELLERGPVDVLDSSSDPSFWAVLGHGPDWAVRASGQLSTSGIEGLDVGTRHGRGVVERVEFGRRGPRLVHLACDCGNRYAVKPSRLRVGGQRSCGCLRRERAATLAQKREAGES